MRTASALSFTVAVAVVLGAAPTAAAAPALPSLELPRESPVGKISQQVGLTEIAVEYGSPAVAGRKIWGALVPFDKVWSLGAAQATKIRFSRDVVFGDKPVPAGTYALYAVPGKSSWTLIVNKNPDQPSGARDYRATEDVARVVVHPKASPARERLAFAFGDFNDDGATLEIAWEKVKVTVPIRVNTTDEVLTSINALDNTWRAYANAARYMLETKKDYDTGLRYVSQSLALKDDWYNGWIKALLLAAKGSYKEAETAAQHVLELGLKSGDPQFPEADVRAALTRWGAKSVAAR